MTQLKLNEHIALLRKQHGLTQEELANALGVTNQTVSKWESSQCCPDIQHLPTLAALFHVSVDALLGCAPLTEAPPQPCDAEPAAVVRTAAALHITALCRLTDDCAQMHLQQPEKAAERAAKGEWGYSALYAPELTTTMRRGTVLFSDNTGLDLSRQNLRRIAALLKPFGNADTLRVLTALYALTVHDESVFADTAAIAEKAALAPETVRTILENDLPPYLEESDQGCRIAGMYMNLLPIFSLLDYK